ncbi:MAG: TRAP transporter, DctM subunit [Oscillospiraceae bacterium]|jgi:tripartite ATP-independent transporter DctM subunit
MILLLISFLVMMLLGVPIANSLLFSSVLYLMTHDIPMQMAFQTTTSAISESFVLISVPFFILAANVMNTGGITKKIFGFANTIVGWIPGGLGHANIASSVIFSGMSGAAIADAGGLGAIELQAMKDEGYDEDFSLAITGASSIIGPIIPPSTPAILFGVSGGVSIGMLFLGGLVPGLLMAIAMGVFVYIQSKKRHYPHRAFPTPHEVGHSFIQALFPLLTPVIIIGGIMSGIYTPTEAAVIAVVYALILTLTTRELKLSAIPNIVLETAANTVNVMFIIASASIFAWILTIEQVPQSMSTFMLKNINNPIVALLLINIILVVVGTFMETAAAISILTPILMPICLTFGIDPIHFGIMCILNLMIGLLTPPIGMVLYVLSSVAKVPFEKIVKAIWPYILLLIGILLLITFVPQIVTFLPYATLGTK